MTINEIDTMVLGVGYWVLVGTSYYGARIEKHKY